MSFSFIEKTAGFFGAFAGVTSRHPRHISFAADYQKLSHGQTIARRGRMFKGGVSKAWQTKTTANKETISVFKICP
jgi:hypothetical protein